MPLSSCAWTIATPSLYVPLSVLSSSASASAESCWLYVNLNQIVYHPDFVFPVLAASKVKIDCLLRTYKAQHGLTPVILQSY